MDSESRHGGVMPRREKGGRPRLCRYLSCATQKGGFLQPRRLMCLLWPHLDLR